MAPRSETQSIECNADLGAVLELITDPRHIPQWAPAFADAVVEDIESGWRATKDGEDFRLRVVANRDAGTADYLRELSPGRKGGAYLRAIPRPGGGSVVVMTLPVPPGADGAAVAKALRTELDALAFLAELA
jgi:hypothetical protein